MSGLSFNKLAGAGLATAFTIAILSIVVPMLFQRSPPTHPGYIIAVPLVAESGAEAPDVPPDWGTVLPIADVAAGEAKTAACKSCHSFDPSGVNGLVGPGLYGVVGRKPGSHPGFAYSTAMIAFGAKQPIWDYDHLYDFLKGPQAYIDGTKMTFIGLKAPQDRINVIAYLHTLGSNLPIPPPHPKAPPAPAAPAAGAPAAPGAAAPATGTTPAATTGAPASAGPKVGVITIQSLAYGPAPAGLRVGDTVEWRNADIFRHSATATDGSFNVDMAPSASGRFKLTKAGAIAYTCKYHPGMKGVIQVAA